MTDQEIFAYSYELNEAIRTEDTEATQDIIGKIVKIYSNDLSKIAVSNITEPIFIFALRTFLQAIESTADENSLIEADIIQNSFNIKVDIT